MTLKITDANYDREVELANQLVIIFFWEEQCGPCRILSSVIEELANDYKGSIQAGKLKVCNLNLDENPETASTFDFKSLPRVLFFINGSVVFEHAGIISKAELAKNIGYYQPIADKLISEREQ
ncbi:thioredoxin 1 [Chitinophaga jiangningensis]|uniref:Thioredoxin n=1 Tax=Chitinophaga jiangningensis TaxID=1419482 RepID=A0A1M7L2P4_9BACT|nr:thioredoxin domain-containing protein [Chitinophaga jiangningensis]SHM72180.1 thioredoxin 1 [Chitinophaga jiangningensis]